MKEDFIPYKLALELKELGFNEEVSMYYTHGNTNMMPGELMKNKIAFVYNMPEKLIDNYYIDAPTWSQSFDWLLNKLPFGYGIKIMKGKCELWHLEECILHRDSQKQQVLEKLIGLTNGR